MHLYNSVHNHPVWGGIITHLEGRCEAEVLRDLFVSLGVKEEQILPLELDSLSCGGNASCSKALVDKLGMKVDRVLMIQVGFL